MTCIKSMLAAEHARLIIMADRGPGFLPFLAAISYRASGDDQFTVGLDWHLTGHKKTIVNQLFQSI